MKKVLSGQVHQVCQLVAQMKGINILILILVRYMSINLEYGLQLGTFRVQVVLKVRKDRKAKPEIKE